MNINIEIVKSMNCTCNAYQFYELFIPKNAVDYLCDAKCACESSICYPVFILK